MPYPAPTASSCTSTFQDLLQNFIFDDMIIQAKINIGQQIAQEKNSVGSKWMNIVELIIAQDVQDVDQSSTNVSEHFMNAMNNYKNTLLDLDTDDKDLGEPSSMTRDQLERSMSKARKTTDCNEILTPRNIWKEEETSYCCSGKGR